MARRPVFLPTPDGPTPVITRLLDFEWFAGLSLAQKQKSILSLHNAAHEQIGTGKMLEVSTKSPEPLGVALSAFNLSFQTKMLAQPMSVECAFQGSKVFEHGGPFTELFRSTSRDAKRDERLTTSGRLTSFRFMGKDWPLEPQTAFYDWLYINALKRREDLAQQLCNYVGFTDIEFNPNKSINCQAYSVALFRSVQQRNCLEAVTNSPESFLDFLQNMPVSNAHQNDILQRQLF